MRVDLRLRLSNNASRNQTDSSGRAIAAMQGLPVIADEAFIDLDFGEWNGLPLEEVKRKYADLYRVWRERPQDATFPGGENLTQVRARAWDGLQRVVRSNQERTILIVAHRVGTKILICAALGLDNSHFWQIKQDTTAVNYFECRSGFFVVSLMNDTCHLKAISPGIGKKDF
jgi:broad specificity phosphatase PhoE